MKQKLGIVLDDGHFYEDMGLQKMKNLIAPLYSAWDERAYAYYRQRFGLTEDKKIGELSRGMRVKYALVLALSHMAEILVLDEPAAGLDPLARRELMEILGNLVKKEKKRFFCPPISRPISKKQRIT